LLHFASGSSCAPEPQCHPACEPGYIRYEHAEQPLAACQEVRQMPAGLLNKLAADS
jgi:hypothetical protein